MSKISCCLSLVACLLVLGGCAGKRVSFEPRPNRPLFTEKNEFYKNYFRLVTESEKKNGYPGLGIRPFGEIDSLDELNRFIDNFWKVRDPNPNTSENEFKALIDSRIEDINNEVFASDSDIPLTRFDKNGGLKGELAQVYLLHGVPHFKAKISEGMFHVELMVWYYFYQDKPLMRFLFYDDGSRMRLFRDQFPINSLEELLYSTFSPLKKISRDQFSNFENTWQELRQNEIYITVNGYSEPVFMTSLFEFSYFSEDVVMEGGGGKKLGALDPPEPAALIAERYKPTITGQPGDLSKREFMYNPYNSFIPALLRLKLNYILIKYGDLDWELKDDKNAETILALRISFQDKSTKKLREFYTTIGLALNKEFLNRNNITAKEFIEKNKNGSLAIVLGQLPNELSGGKLDDLIKQLEPGTHVVNVDLRNVVTKKSAGGWREEIVVK